MYLRNSINIGPYKVFIVNKNFLCVWSTFMQIIQWLKEWNSEMWLLWSSEKVYMTLVAQPEENIAGTPPPVLDYMRGKQQTQSSTLMIRIKKLSCPNSMVSSGLLENPLYLVIRLWVFKSASRKSSQNCGDRKIFTINRWYFVEMFTLYFLDIEQSLILHKQRIIFDSFIQTNSKVK